MGSGEWREHLKFGTSMRARTGENAGVLEMVNAIEVAIVLTGSGGANPRADSDGRWLRTPDDGTPCIRRGGV